MVILLFTASFLLSLAVSYVISKLFRVRRGLSQPLFCQTPQRSGRQVPAVRYRVRRCYQRHKNPPAPGLHRRSPWNRPELAAELTQEVWALSIYHTLVDLFYGIVWLLVVFTFLALAAFFYLRRSHLTSLLAKPEPAGAPEETRPVAASR